jgi:hypothetical protein
MPTTGSCSTPNSGFSSATYPSSGGYPGCYKSSIGLSGDKPLIGDWDGDLRTDIAVHRPSSATIYVLSSNGTSCSSLPFFASASPWCYSTMINTWDIPVPADFDGDGITDIMWWDVAGTPRFKTWGTSNLTAGTCPANFTYNGGTSRCESPAFGASGDIPLAKRIDPDSAADPISFYPGSSQSYWTVLPTSTPSGGYWVGPSSGQYYTPWGLPGDKVEGLR